MKFWLIKFGGLLGVLLFLNVGLGVAEDQPYKPEVYQALRTQGLEAIEQRKSYTLVFLSPHQTFYEVMKIRFRGEQSIMAIRSYDLFGKLMKENGFQVSSFEKFINNFQKNQYLAMQIP